MPLPRRVPELKTLDLLLSVAETGSLGRAAAQHRISQPAASQRLQRLERELGLRLLVRTPNGSRLTPDGEAVLGWARPVVDAAAQLATAVEALRSRAAGVLDVAASLTLADHLVPRWLSRLHAAAPGARVALRVANSSAVVELVRHGEVVLGFVESPRAPRDLRCRVVGGDRVVVVVPPAHPWGRRRRPLPVRTLAGTPLAVREPGSGTREALEQALASAGEQLRPAVELGSTAALKLAATSGDAPAVLSALAVADEVADDRLRVVPVDGLEVRRAFRALWRPEQPPAGHAATLLAIAARAPFAPAVLADRTVSGGARRVPRAAAP